MIIFDIFVSFAGNDRDNAKQVVSALKKKGLKVFYDYDHRADLLGKDLLQHFYKLIIENSLFFAPLISCSYIEGKWPLFELGVAQAKEFDVGAEFILPIKLDDSAAPALPSTKGYLDLRKLSSTRIATIICKKLEIKKNVTNFNNEHLYSSIMHSFEFLQNRFFLLSRLSKAAEFAHLPALISTFKDTIGGMKNKLNVSY